MKAFAAIVDSAGASLHQGLIGQDFDAMIEGAVPGGSKLGEEKEHGLVFGIDHILWEIGDDAARQLALVDLFLDRPL